jgi:formate hydrogenlyase transcriptional activator
MQRLCTYAWPGNVRELQNVIERAALLSPGEMLVLPPDVTPAAVVPPRPAPAPDVGTSSSLEELHRRHIETVLARTDWQIEGEDGAARALDLKPSTLRSRIKKLGIKRPTGTA